VPLVAVTVGWELYAIVAVSDAGVGFLDVALAVPIACLLAIAWALARRPVRAAGWRRPGLLALWASFPVLGAALVAIYHSSQSPINPLFRARFLVSERRSLGPRRGWPPDRVRPRGCGSASSAPPTRP